MKTLQRFKMQTCVLTLIGLSALTVSSAFAAAPAITLQFATHAAFFSGETKQKAPLDPQVFIAMPTAPAGTGPQGIKHVAGIRNALISDDADLPIQNAAGKPLGMSLGQWLSAKGEVVLTPLDRGKERVTVILSGLKSKGIYSLFENHFDQSPVGFTPLGGTGTDNNFSADAHGNAIVSTVSSTILTHDNAVLVVYHSDQKAHGKLRGDLGMNAHHQLIARPQ
jgi:hypothetical protein